MKRDEKDTSKKIGITIGDPAGVGAEITVKTLAESKFANKDILVIGDRDVIEDVLKITGVNLEINSCTNLDDLKYSDGINLLDLGNIDLNQFEYGEIGKKSGQAAAEYIYKGIDLALEGKLAGVVTGPIHKEAIRLAGVPHAGHTEMFATKCNTDDYAMMLTEDDFRVVHVSTHVSLREACERVKKDRVYQVINLAHRSLQSLGIDKPRIAVAGLNPHAGEHGLFGEEEIKEINPAIEMARKEGISVEGPIPPDTVFSKARGGQYDITVVMYHDQGHIPMKTVGFQYDEEKGDWLTVSGVNVTLGLPIVRTSVDHGVAFDIAGQGKANSDSMKAAIKMAFELTN